MNIAILGYGIVGGGVHELLRGGRLGIRVKRVMDIRPIEALGGLLTDNIAEVLGDPDIQCVVETIGGMHPALSYVTSALRGGKHVVTSNKELVSRALAPLAEGAALHNVQLRFSASVGGGVPWIENLARQKRSDTIESIEGIVNGTTNFILDAMASGSSFADALLRAQQLGYAEIDPSADLDGIDAQRKCAISASIAFDAIVEPEQVPALGIRSIRSVDTDAFAAKGLVCKLMMHAGLRDGTLHAYVEPTLLPHSAPAAHTPTNHNCISLHAKNTGHLAFFGQGAGRYPTAQNIVQDLLEIRARTVFRPHGVQPLTVDNSAPQQPYYVRTARPLPDGLQPAQVLGEGVLTQPVSVLQMHTAAKALLAADPAAFIAGLPG